MKPGTNEQYALKMETTDGSLLYVSHVNHLQKVYSFGDVPYLFKTKVGAENTQKHIIKQTISKKLPEGWKSELITYTTVVGTNGSVTAASAGDIPEEIKDVQRKLTEFLQDFDKKTKGAEE